MKRWRKIVAGAAIALAAVSSQIIAPEPAHAQVSYNTDWIQGRVSIASGGGLSFRSTDGIWLHSRSNLKKYLLVPAHVVRACQSCPDNGLATRITYEGSSVNWWDSLSVLDPLNPAYEYYDMALIDFGQSFVPPTNKWWYYCTALNCTSFQGGGTQKNANWAGTTGNIVGASTGQAGWGVVKSGAISGTSTGTIVSAMHAVYDGWDYWGIHYTGITGCGVTDGDSGAPIMTGPNIANSVFLGMHTSSFNGWWAPGPSPCYGDSRVISADGVYITYADVVAAYPGLSLSIYVAS